MTHQNNTIYARKLLPMVNWVNQTCRFHLLTFLEDYPSNLEYISPYNIFR